MRRLYPGIFLVAATTLMLELVLTRVFDVILAPNMAYMVITCAMMCFGLAGIYVVLRPIDPSQARRSVARVCLGFAAGAVVLRPVLNLLPFDYDELTAAPLLQLGSFLGMYTAIAVPFFLAGLVFTRLFSAYATRIQSLYCWDLVGAGVGCVVIIPLIPPFGPGGVLLWCAAFACAASALFAEDRRWTWGALAAAAVFLALPLARYPDYFEFREHVGKRGVADARRAGEIEVTRWDPISKIDVVRIEGLPRKHIAYDGGNQSSNFYAFDGDFEALRRGILSGAEPVENHFWFPGVLAGHYLKRDRGHRALVIGSAGGQEATAALVFGADTVDAVELVGAVIDLGRGRYAEYTGGLFLTPRVNMIKGEGRSFLRASGVSYDVIQIFSNHTSSSVGAGTGAMSPSYLQTVEAYRDYFTHLAGDGILHVNHHVYPRVIATAAAAWRDLGRSDFQRHVVVFQQREGKDNLPTVLFKMDLWTQAEIDDLRTLMALSGEARQFLVEDPLHPEQSFLAPAFYTGQLPPELRERVLFRVTPATDDNPYFNFLRRTFRKVETDPDNFLDHATAWILNQRTRKFVPMDVVHLMVTGAVSLLFALAFVVLPLRFSSVGRLEWPRRGAALAYFACLGAGFIIIELVFIQLFMRLIGFPLYAVSLVILAMLVAAGLGSLCSEKLGIGLERRWFWPFVGIAIAGTVLFGSYAGIFATFLAAPMPVRLLVSFLLIFPLGFFLGMPFPLGILHMNRMPVGSVAWAWALNGLFTLIGGLASVVLSVYAGFEATLLLGFSIYGLAFAMLARMRTAPAWDARGAAALAPGAVAQGGR